jgi:DNA-binding response OmpR family regulator
LPDDENVRPSVLIIEDDPSISEIVSRVLDKEGFVTHAAFDGAQGLDAYYLTQPDIIILDVKMPVMDGWETLTRLRRVSETPVIMLTVYSAKQDIIKGLELGADDYLVKPFGIKELIARVTTVLRRTSMVL